LQGNTYKSDVYSKTFTVPKPAGDNGTGGDGGIVACLEYWLGETIAEKRTVCTAVYYQFQKQLREVLPELVRSLFEFNPPHAAWIAFLYLLCEGALSCLRNC
jgi:hypothetical protein